MIPIGFCRLVMIVTLTAATIAPANAQRPFRRPFQRPINRPTPQPPRGQLQPGQFAPQPTPAANNRAATSNRANTAGSSSREIIKEEITTNLPQFWEVYQTPTQVSLRGVFAVGPSCAWACGAQGMVVRTTDGGESWKSVPVKDASKADLRDIHAIDESVAFVLQSTNPATIYQTTDGGATWEINFRHKDSNVVLTAFEFWDDSNGIAVGNPVNGKITTLLTNDGGITWKELKSQYCPSAAVDERGFAASGSNLALSPNGTILIGLGGTNPTPKRSSRVLVSRDRGGSWSAGAVPMLRSNTQGIFSIAFATEKHAVAVGGNYRLPDQPVSSDAMTEDGGITWAKPSSNDRTGGFRSCVTVWHKGREIVLVAVGPNGTDISTDLGKNWRPVSKDGFHVVNFTDDGKAGWAAGSQGRVARCISR